MEIAYVSCGSNLGDREQLLGNAVRALGRDVAVRLRRVSSLYETDPVGPPPQGPYLNGAVELATTLEPRDLLRFLLQLEANAGRVRAASAERWSARPLDLDLLLYGTRTIDEAGLQVPHPRLGERAFVLEPLAEIAAEVVPPNSGQTLRELAKRVRDPGGVRGWPSESWTNLAAEVSQPVRNGGGDGNRSSQYRAGR